MPGLAVWRASRSARSISSIARRPGSERTPPASSAHARATRDVGGDRRAGAAGDVRIGRRSEQRQKRLDHRVVPRQRGATRGCERRHAGLERDREGRGVLARDPVAVGGEPHHLEQRQRRLVRDILRLRPSEPARRRATDRRVDVARVIDRGGLEHPAQARCGDPLPRASRDPSAARASGASKRTMPRLVFDASSGRWLRPRGAPSRRPVACPPQPAARRSRPRWPGNPRSECRRNGVPARRCPASAHSPRGGRPAVLRPRRLSLLARSRASPRRALAAIRRGLPAVHIRPSPAAPGRHRMYRPDESARPCTPRSTVAGLMRGLMRTARRRDLLYGCG